MGIKKYIATLIFALTLGGFHILNTHPATLNLEAAELHTPKPPLTGFSIHFDFIDTLEDADRLIEMAYKSGAQIFNVIPSPHVWENPLNLEILKRIFKFANTHHIGIILTRIDASGITGRREGRDNYIYTRILSQRGKLPNGKETPQYFCNPVGNKAFSQWQKVETLYYAKHFSNEPCLMGFSIGMFNEPFVSQRGSLLCFDEEINSYEIAQYTHEASEWWHDWLTREYINTQKINSCYSSSFKRIEDIPMPKNEKDIRFGNPKAAYWDLTRSLNHWVVSQYEECRAIWHKYRKRDIPFILQFSGYEPEKLEKGRAAFVNFDIFDWMARADAIGMSLYTNNEYPDRGHDSDRSLIHYLKLGKLLKTPLFILESGYEDNGAVADPGELNFFVELSRELQPQCIIYEFLKMSYDETFPNHSGKIIDKSWQIDQTALTQIRNALEQTKVPLNIPPSAYIYDDPETLKNSDKELNFRKEMLRLGYKEPIVFVPKRALNHLPRHSTLVVPQPAQTPELLKALKRLNIEIIDSETFLLRFKK